jgi:hypothetical protein
VILGSLRQIKDYAAGGCHLSVASLVWKPSLIRKNLLGTLSRFLLEFNEEYEKLNFLPEKTAY